MKSTLFDRLERAFRHLSERAGGVLDFAMHRAEQPQQDLATLLPRIESAIEKSLREEQGRLTAPHLIELRYSYETWTQLGEARREKLERELAASLFEFAHNRRYLLANPLRVMITCDPFTRGVEIRPSFDASTSPPARGASKIVLIEQGRGLRHEAQLVSGAEPIGVGRNIANKVVISDPTISNFHAAFIRRENGEIELADRGGANGTAINGVLLAGADRRTVASEDLIRFGRVECRLIVE